MSSVRQNLQGGGTVLGTYVSPVRTVASRREVCGYYWDAFQELGLNPTVPFVTVMVAHAALECGNFVYAWNWNWKNQKAGSKWTGLYTCITLNEILRDKDGKPRERWFSPEGELTASPKKGGVLKDPVKKHAVPPGDPQTRMRAFDSPQEAAKSLMQFFLDPKWQHVLEPARRGDPSGFVRAIRAKGYFTAYLGQPDPTPYEADVCSLFRTYRPIVQDVVDSEERSDSTPVRIAPPPSTPPVRFEPDDEWRRLSTIAYGQALEMDVLGTIRSDSLRNDHKIGDE